MGFPKRKNDEHALLDTEASLSSIYESEDGGYSSLESREALIQLEQKKRKLLEEKEATWRLKSMATWLEKGDENTEFFQAYAKGRKIIKYHMCLKDNQGRDVTSFEGLENLGTQYFKTFSRLIEGLLWMK
jgi:hypothetical protein